MLLRQNTSFEEISSSYPVVGEIRTEVGAVVSLSLVTITARHIPEAEVIMPWGLCLWSIHTQLLFPVLRSRPKLCTDHIPLLLDIILQLDLPLQSPILQLDPPPQSQIHQAPSKSQVRVTLMKMRLRTMEAMADVTAAVSHISKRN